MAAPKHGLREIDSLRNDAHLIPEGSNLNYVREDQYFAPIQLQGRDKQKRQRLGNSEMSLISRAILK